VDVNHVNMLMNDTGFIQRTTTLNPITNGSDSIQVVDPVPQHSALDSELVVLSIFAQEIMRLIFPNSTDEMHLLCSNMTERKGGLILGKQVIIKSTTV